jgi:hypothetical protein
MINFRRLVPLNTYNVKHLDTAGIPDDVRNALSSFKTTYSSQLVNEANASKVMRTLAKEAKEQFRKENKPTKPVLSPEQKEAKKIQDKEKKRSKRIKTDNALICKNV